MFTQVGKILIALFLVTFIMFGCASKQKETERVEPQKERGSELGSVPFTIVQFLDVQTEEALSFADGSEADKYELGLNLGGYDLDGKGIYALDKNVVFLFGSLGIPGASIRSLLLRSDDGGNTWKEVITPVDGSDVIKVLFLDKRTGWALVGWTVEGPGDLLLYGTKDSQKSWKKVSDIPKRDFMGWPVSFEFFDEKNGRMEMLYEGGDDTTDGLAVMVTSDGGHRWREISNLSLDEYREKYENNGEPRKPPVDYVSGKDGSQWKLQQSEKQISVLRRLHKEDDWSVMSTIPTSFKYSEGRVISPHE